MLWIWQHRDSLVDYSCSSMYIYPVGLLFMQFWVNSPIISLQTKTIIRTRPIVNTLAPLFRPPINTNKPSLLNKSHRGNLQMRSLFYVYLREMGEIFLSIFLVEINSISYLLFIHQFFNKTTIFCKAAKKIW